MGTIQFCEMTMSLIEKNGGPLNSAKMAMSLVKKIKWGPLNSAKWQCL